MRNIELRQLRAKMIEDAKQIAGKAAAEKRSLSNEENETIDRMFNDEKSLMAEIERIERIDKLAEGVREVANEVNLRGNDTEKSAFERYLRTGRMERALNTADDAAMVPQSIVEKIETALAELNFFRQRASVIKTTSTSTIPVVGDITVTVEGESDELAETEPSISGKTMKAYKMSALVKLAEEFVEDTGFDIFSVLANRFADGFSDKELDLFSIGAGSTTVQGVVTGATAFNNGHVTALTADGILNFYHALPQKYRANACWIMNDAIQLVLRKLKLKSETDGNFVFYAPGVAAGSTDSLLGKPVFVSPTMDSAATSAKVIACFGDLSKYQIADRGGVQMKRLNETFAANGQVGFRAYKRIDGQVMIADAFRKLVMSVG